MNYQAQNNTPNWGGIKLMLVNALASQFSSQTVIQLSTGILNNNNPQLEVRQVVLWPPGSVGDPRSGSYSIQEWSLMSKKEYKAAQ